MGRNGLRHFAALIGLAALASCGGKSDAPAAGEPPAAASSTQESGADAAAAPATTAPAGPSLGENFAWPKTTLFAKIATSKGDILVELYPEQAPRTVGNFLEYAEAGFYDRLIFHRVVAGFVIQGGGYNQYYAERPTGKSIPYEGDNGLKNYRGTIAMARGSHPESATSQWYVNLKDNEGLDHFVNDLGPRYGYAVFGRVIEGMEVADAIGAIATGAGGPFDKEVPVETVTILRVDKIDQSAPAP